MIAAHTLPQSAWWTQPPASQWVEVIPLFDAGERPWLLSAADDVVRLATLPDDWDGEGSPRIELASVTKAVEVLCKLATAVEPLSHVSPVPGGGLQLEWFLPDRYLEIEIFPDGSVEYLTRTGHGEPTEGTLSLADTQRIRELIAYLSHR